MKNKIKIKNRDLIFLTKRLAFMLKAGIPLEEGLSLIISQTSNKKIRGIVENLSGAIASGKTLHDGFEKYVIGIPQSSLQLIKAGERNGFLANNLEFLSEDLLKRDKLKQKVVSALLYPCCIGIGTIALSSFMTFFIFPKIRPLFNGLNITLPLSTRILIIVTDICKTYWIYILLAISALSGTLAYSVKKIRSARYFKDWLITKLPILSSITTHYTLAVVLRDIGIKLKSGIVLQEALDPLVAGNVVFQNQILRAQQALSMGENLSIALLKEKGAIPAVDTQMIATGELSGSLPETCMYLSDFHEQEVDALSKNLTNILEPVLMTFMGIIVGFISLSILLPIYQISQNINH